MFDVMDITLRPAQPADVDLIVQLIHELADYERTQAAATVENISDALFGSPPKVFCEIAEADGKPVGFGLWFYTFSTFQGRAGIFLEDLYVRPEARGAGVGGTLLRHLAQRCLDDGLGRLSWQVLDWNKQAIEFYLGLGAKLTEDWIGCRLEGGSLKALATAP